MLNRLLKTKVSYARTQEELLEKFNYLVKTLNSSTFSTQDALSSEISPTLFTLDGIELSQSWASGLGAYVASFTLNHNLGVIPSRWIISDSTASGIATGGSYSIYRASWTTTQITITISVDANAVTAISGTFKILVLR